MCNLLTTRRVLSETTGEWIITRVNTKLHDWGDVEDQVDGAGEPARNPCGTSITNSTTSSKIEPHSSNDVSESSH